MGTNISGGGEFRGIATNGKRTVAVGLYGSVIYTDNGRDWKSANSFSYDNSIVRPFLYDVAWGANKFVAVGHNGVYTSADGVSWKLASIPSKERYMQLSNILWTGKFFIASDQSFGVYTSKDGFSWTKVNSVSNDWLMSMVWDGKRVIATVQVYNGGKQYTKIMQTTNGTDWTELAKLDVIVADIAWNGKSYVAVYPYDPSRMWISTDGKKWTKAKPNLKSNLNFQFITSFDGQFFAMSNQLTESGAAYYVSKDGLKWREVPIANKNTDSMFGSRLLDGIKAHGKYIFVGTYGEIMYTNELQLEDPITIKVNGKPLSFSNDLGKPYIKNGTTYVPLNIIGVSLGYKVIWNKANQSVNLVKDNTTVVFSDVQLNNGRSYVPLRKISENLGYEVNYGRKNEEVIIAIDNK